MVWYVSETQTVFASPLHGQCRRNEVAEQGTMVRLSNALVTMSPLQLVMQ